MIIEICAGSFNSAVFAQEGGADRIELCTELSVGGITPSYGLLKNVMQSIHIPVHVLVRPRAGNFTFSNAAIDTMLRDIELCGELGCAGIVSGVLTNEHKVDRATTQKLIAASGEMEFTFHRAFDWTPDPFFALNQLLELGATRILTSGQANTAVDGIELLKQLYHKAEGKIEIMPGAGINAKNAMHFKNSGFQSIHLSASQIQKPTDVHDKIPMHDLGILEDGGVRETQLQLVQEIVKYVSGRDKQD